MTELLLAASARLIQLTAASYSVDGVRQPSSLIFGEYLQTFKRQIAALQLPWVASPEQQHATSRGIAASFDKMSRHGCGASSPSASRSGGSLLWIWIRWNLGSSRREHVGFRIVHERIEIVIPDRKSVV